MSVNAADIYHLAAQLSKGATEAELRSAVSRAYYAAYHACLAWHKNLPSPGSNSGPAGGVHQELCNRLKNPAPEVSPDLMKSSRRLSVMLSVLRSQRGLADYEVDLNSIDTA